LNQSLLYVHTSLSLTLNPVFLFTPLHLSNEKKIIHRYKKYWWVISPPSPPSYACEG